MRFKCENSQSSITVTIASDVKDLAGNPMTANKTWVFSTVTQPTAAPTSPASGSTDVALNQPIMASFSKDMDSATISSLTFTVVGPGGVPVSGEVTFDPVTRVATFNASPTNVIASTIYTATIASGAKDVAGNPMLLNCTWTFTTGMRTLAKPAVLGAAALFGVTGGGAGMTNTGNSTVVTGDIGTTGAATTVTGFHDSVLIYTETGANIGTVSGLIYTATTPSGPGAMASATAGINDAQTAYNNLSPASLPGGINIVTAYGGAAGELGGRTLFPGIYKATAPTTYAITGDNLTLDAQGDSNAVWVFQIGSTLTVGDTASRSVILINGAQAKNVYWQVGSAATINAVGGGTMVGTIISTTGVTFSTAGNVAITTLNGRALGLTAAVTLVNTVITVP